ncbi:head-tail connector protein [Caulobacter phage Jess A]|nr:head-tail connector protein [Caulobacter phage Jess A]WCA46463.1 head-to-tail connector protein [Caulobacter phage RapA]
MVTTSLTDQYEPIQRPAAEDPYAKRDVIYRRWGALKAERASWDTEARELARFLMPRAGRFTTSDRNRGEPRNSSIYDNTPLKAVRTLAAGMMSGMTSPARPWFRLKTPDEEMMAYEPVKIWCSDVTRLLLDVFAKSNVYRALHQAYGELAVFGTHSTILQPDFDNVIHATSLTWGEYCIAADGKGKVNTLYREFDMTADQMVREFGLENVSGQVSRAWARGSYDDWFTVVHAIEPRADRDPAKVDPMNMEYRSIYFEQGQQRGQYLRESGYRRFNALCPRWQVTGGDIYGDSPGMEALGDAKQLQHEQLRKAQAIDYQTKPPVGLPSLTKGQEANLLPGGVTYMDMTGGVGQRQLFDVKLDLNALLMDIGDVRGRINSAMYADLFLMLSNIDASSSRMTATEVAERHEEKLLMLGPVLERLHNELLDPLVDMTFEELAAAGALPPPPQELEGVPLNVELVSMLAQAQRAVQTNGIDRFLVGVGSVMQLGKVDVADKVDGDALVEIYGDSLGVDPRILLDDDKVAAVRQARAQQQEAAMQAAQGSAVAQGAAELSKVSTQGGASNAGADFINQVSGYTGV